MRIARVGATESPPLFEYRKPAVDPPYESIDGGLAVSHRKAERRVGKRWALIALASALSGCALAQTAVAAVPTPESATLCGGTLKRAKPTADDPNLVNYKFNCNGGITAYTLIVLRKSNDFNTVDDYASSVSVFDPTGNPLSTASFSCSGQIPATESTATPAPAVRCPPRIGPRARSPPPSRTARIFQRARRPEPSRIPRPWSSSW